MIHANDVWFYIHTEKTSYVMQVLPNGTLQHVYYGAKVPEDDFTYYRLFEERAFSPCIIIRGEGTSMDTIPQEYPTFGRGDYRLPACVIEGADGRGINELTYTGYKITKGRKTLEGMPHLDARTEEAETLEVQLSDQITGAKVSLYYTVFAKEDVIVRYTEVYNPTEETLQVRNLASVSMDFERGDLEMISLQGAWARERHINRRKLAQGISSVESRRGSSSHQLNPFVALVEEDTNEQAGGAYGFSFVYSGDFKIAAEVNQFDNIRLQVGLNPETFSWQLKEGERFVTPEAWMTYSAEGLNQMSQNFHRVSREHLGQCAVKDRRRPVIINSWEAMYFQMSDEKIAEFIQDCKGLGIDTFVLDDGWFGHRDDDTTSLGDWVVDRKKFKDGLHNVVRCCKEHHMKFGIWFEPEMISEDSLLFEAHPDWHIHHPKVEPIKSRHQYILDMSRKEVVDQIYDQMAKIIEEYDVSYIKWDMNRNMTDNGSEMLSAEQQREHGYRYIRGVYDLMARLVKNYPQVFFEGCSGGGGRFDYGILYYMPQIWTSDDSDAVERMKIQYGTSMAYPPATMVGHVSACPNHQTARTTPFATRGETAQMCNYGYELNVGLLSEEEKAMIKDQIKRHQELEPLLLDGEFYRLQSPFAGNRCAWEMVSRDQKKAYVYIGYQYTEPNAKSGYLKVQGLKAEGTYYVRQLNVKLQGATLMRAGLPVRMPWSDHATLCYDLELQD